ncbi:hypothetical protein K456DRAFT_1726486 [Colletotrichum gloeosporioides 23]|nr:hypothetical protein K456DRAFT_1726486 [Colletotrichum gloeosporioides 23]
MIIEGCDVPLCDTIRPENEENCFPYSFKEKKKELLPKGWQKTLRSRPLPSELIYEVNEEMRHSDGVKIYYDICRPNTVEKVPALLALSPYGKGGNGFLNYELLPYRVGVQEEMLSGLEKFESVDPAEWVSRGYAVVNVDIRGSWDSEGDLYIEGMAAGRDAAEIVEHVAALSWFSGSIGMQGNSWLAAVQWSTAVVAPPALKAIAPWEGFTDKYREVACRGGIADATFLNLVYNGTIRGRSKREHIFAAAQKWPLINPYWEDKVIKTEKITIPIYAVTSYSSGIHGYGTIQGFRKAKTFFDRYLKGVENDWEKTDPVRVSILTCGDRFGPQPIEYFPMGSYPHAKTEYKKLYLTKDNLSLYHPPASGITSYQSDDRSSAVELVYTFNTTTTLMGFSKAKLWLSCDDTDDMDIYLSLRKVISTNVIKSTGPHGLLRVSHRAMDRSKQDSIMPYHPHEKIEKVQPGEIVPVEIGIWPIGLKLYEGEGLMLRVRGSKDAYWEIPNLQKSTIFGINKGKHHIHFGGMYDSYVAVPFIPNV